MYDFITDEGFWINNYKIVATDITDGQNVTISGRFYDFHGGYVDISTETTLFVATVDDYPSSGKLRMTGASGAWIEIEFRNEGTPELLVTVDLDSEPGGEWNSGWLPWEPIT